MVVMYIYPIFVILLSGIYDQTKIIKIYYL
jgi:hypothetical protein